MRKDLLASSLKAVRDGKQAAQPDAEQKPRKLAGVLDVQRGLDQLSSGAPRSVDPALIAESAIKDRFNITEGLDDLIASIRASGQRLPVLLRRIKSGPLPYEVVYGRRRIEACRQLGIEVQAYVSEMDDREALISQGLENAARLQRSFIEQAVYADRLIKHDFSREEIMEVLAVDKTTIIRMLGVVSSIPAAVIEAIGPAHDSGRRPWQQLRDAIQQQPDIDEQALVERISATLSSNDRLRVLLKSLKKKPDSTGSTPSTTRELPGGIKIECGVKRLSVRHASKEMEGFTEFLDAQMDRLVAEFIAARSEGSG